MDEFEFLLEDRIAKIKSINEQLDLENNAHISFSGGKDSTVLHYLIDLALPNNKIPRVFINTGLEYLKLVKFVKEFQQADERIIIFNQTKKIKPTLEKYGYPFKSKEHSQKVLRGQRLLRQGKEISPFLKGYVKGQYERDGKTIFVRRPCPDILKYQFSEVMPFLCSDLCCQKLKKDNFHLYEKESNRNITITGMRSEEGGHRSSLTCLTANNTKFHPLIVVDEKWEDEFIKRFNIKLCELYYPPYNFVRTGCKGCPFAINLQEQLLTMKKLLPNEYKSCIHLWKPVYDEYVRLGYRLDKDFYDKPVQYTIDDFMEG